MHVLPHAAWIHQSAVAPGQQRELPLSALPHAQYERSCGTADRTEPRPVRQVSGVHNVPHADPWFQLRSSVLPVVEDMPNGLSKECRRLLLRTGSGRGLPALAEQHIRPEFGTNAI